MMIAMVAAWYYAAAIIVRRRRGKIAILLMRTVKRRGPDAGLELYQVPGGMEELCDNGNPIKTLDRELQQETGFHLRMDHPADPPVFHVEMMPDGHVRYFYLLWRNWLRGELRTGVVYDSAKELHELIWADWEFVEKNLCESQWPLLPKIKELFVRNGL